MDDAEQPSPELYRLAQKLRELADQSHLPDIQGDLRQLAARFDRMAAYLKAQRRLGAARGNLKPAEAPPLHLLAFHAFDHACCVIGSACRRQRDQVMHVTKDQQMVVDMSLRAVAELPPAISDIDTRLLQAPEQRYRVREKAACRAGDRFPDATEAAQAKIFTSEMAIKVTNDALQLFGAAGYSRNRPLERMVRDARMFTIGGGTAQILRTVVASRLLGRKLPQSRDGYVAKTGFR